MPKNLEKIGFPMLPAKNRFHILVLHLKKKTKKVYLKKKTPFYVLLLDLYRNRFLAVASSF